MIRTVAIGRHPIDVASELNLDGSRITLENLGGAPIRFAPAAAAGEAAPADLRAGFLLEPGKRENLQPAGGAGFPLWVWGGGKVGVGPAIAPATGLGGGGGLSLLVADGSVTGALDGAHVAGAAVLTVGDASIYRTGRPVQVGGELHTLEAIDEAARTITIEAAGLTADQAANVQVVQAPLLGADDILTLDGGPWAEIDVRFLYDLPQLNGNPAFYNGRSSGAYYSGGGRGGSYFETLSNFSYWWASGQVEDAATWSVGLIHATSNAGNAWSVEFNPATHQLSLLPLDDTLTVSFIPRIYNLIVAGRGA